MSETSFYGLFSIILIILMIVFCKKLHRTLSTITFILFAALITNALKLSSISSFVVFLLGLWIFVSLRSHYYCKLYKKLHPELSDDIIWNINYDGIYRELLVRKDELR